MKIDTCFGVCGQKNIWVPKVCISSFLNWPVSKTANRFSAGPLIRSVEGKGIANDDYVAPISLPKQLPGISSAWQHTGYKTYQKIIENTCIEVKVFIQACSLLVVYYSLLLNFVEWFFINNSKTTGQMVMHVCISS